MTIKQFFYIPVTLTILKLFGITIGPYISWSIIACMASLVCVIQEILRD